MAEEIYDFTLEGLRVRLEEILEANYSFETDFRLEDSTRAVFLRHDVDLSIDCALAIARLENKMDIASTFFLMVSSRFYNIGASSSMRGLRELLDLGHRVGLHFDGSVYPGGQVIRGLDEELDYLGSKALEQIDFYSQHKPTSHGWYQLKHNHAMDVRNQTMTNGNAYFSDSTGMFRWGDYRSTLETGKSIQLLLHPIWWSTTRPVHPSRRLDLFLEQQSQENRKEASRVVAKFGVEFDSSGGWPKELTRERLRP